MDETDRTGTRPGSPSSSANPPHGPTRTCIGCRGSDSWSALLRVVAGSTTGLDTATRGVVPVIPDPRHRLGGRGAWLHPTVACCEQAVRRRAFARALRVSAQVDVSAVIDLVNEREQMSTTKDDVRPMGTESGFDADERPMSTQQ